MTIQVTKPPPQNYLNTLQALVDNSLTDAALAKIKEWGLKIEVHNGKLIDMSDTTEAWLRKFITCDSATLVLLDKVRKLAAVNDEVLINGETGTGKELIAHALHGDRNGKFIGVNCAGIPETLIESLLFGHVRGSFTGATDTRLGYMQLAKDGTLFLDEIGELPLMAQAKFLRAIQEKRVMKIGGEKEEEINCRIVCATHQNLWEMVRVGKFRLDLYARLTTFKIEIKPLWKRPCDIEPIIRTLEGGEEMLKQCKIKSANGITFTVHINGSVLSLQEWIPLNVRSLQQMVRRYKVLGELPL